MVKKIICPTDFSETANNAVEYAANIAQGFGAELCIMNVHILVPVEVPDEDLMENTDTLKTMCDETNKTFNIACTYEYEITHSSLEKTISAQAGENTWIVMGTNGIDDIFQYFFGTNTYKVLKKSDSPLLLIPEHIYYKTAEKVVVVLDENFNAKSIFKQMKDYLISFNPEIIFLYLAKSPTDGNKDDAFINFKNEIINALDDSTLVKFKKIFFEDVYKGINDFIESEQADMLAITYYKRDNIPEMFQYSMTKKLIENPQCPILVMHSQDNFNSN